ncbi:MAG: hypothetical protein O3A50_03225 [Planctomycetota bacterium]|nr:hypothetical protein [Planctomycetota bacterium]
MIARIGVVGFCLLAASCQSGPTSTQSNSGLQRTQRNASVTGIVVDGAGLNLRAFVAQMAFVFPDESADLSRSVVRTEMARLESQKLGVVLPARRVDLAFQTFSKGLVAQLGNETTPDDWAMARHDALWRDIQPLYRENLAHNLLYQAVLRADARLSGRVSMFWFVTGDANQARRWAASLQSGRDPKSMLSESLISGPNPDGSYPPMSRDLPGEAGEQLQNPSLGQIVGPIQFEGDRSWRVGVVTQVLAPESQLPPIDVLLDELESQPIDALEARAWFEKMSRRYTVSSSLSPFAGPTQAFEFSR